MRRTRRCSVVLLAVLGLLLALCACGGSSGGGSDSTAPPPAPSEEELENIWEEEEYWEDPEPEPELEPESAPAPKPLTGLVVVNADIANRRGTVNIPVYCIDPDTGAETLISNFSIVQNVEKNGCHFTIGSSESNPFRQLHYLMSKDCTKIAGTKHFSAGSSHAGWFDTNGTFFDVTEALGLEAKSDFDDPVKYAALGFSENYFIFYDETAEQYYSVLVDNLTSANIQEGDIRWAGHPYEKQYHGKMKLDIPGNTASLSFYANNVTSWIDSTRCIANDYNRNTKKVDVGAGTVSDYIPGNSRNNWNGFLSPDGSRIAFMSEPDTISSTETDIYTIPVDGGEPVKVTGYSVSLAARDVSLGNTGTYVLIGWI